MRLYNPTLTWPQCLAVLVFVGAVGGLLIAVIDPAHRGSPTGATTTFIVLFVAYRAWTFNPAAALKLPS